MSLGYDKLLDLQHRPWSAEGHREFVQRFVLVDVLMLALMLGGAINWLAMAWSGIDWIGSSLGAGSWSARAVHAVIAVASVLALKRIFRIYRSI